MAAREQISHTGKVISAGPDGTTVEILSSVACGACQARALCGMGEYESKVVKVPPSTSELYQKGEEVEVVLRASMGLKAVWLCYCIPLLVLVGAALAGLSFGAGELASALAGLGAVAVYYLILWMFRKKLQDEYIFEIHKLKH